MTCNICHVASDLIEPAVLLEKAKESLEGWKYVALVFYRVDYTYYDLSEKELTWLDEVKKILQDTIPAEWKTGCHLLWPQAAFMGEDIFVWEGEITHTIHAQHKRCMKHQILNWDRLFCAFCKEEITDEEIVH